MTITILLIFTTTTLIGLMAVMYESTHPNPTWAYRALARTWTAIEDPVALAAHRFWAFMLRRKTS